MKKVVIAFCVFLGLTALYSCGGSKSSSYNTGYLAGVDDRPKWSGIDPEGMVYIPPGTFNMGPSDQNVNNALIQRSKSKDIQGFWMDDTEITNNEYRQFVYYVRDSIAHSMLDHYEEDDNGNQKIDWSYDIDWAADSEDAEAIGELFYTGEDQFWGNRDLNARKLMYKREWYDWKKAASKSWEDADNSDRKLSMRERNARSSFIQEQEVNIYPDTLCWIHDFSYAYNEPMTRNYFSHPAFDDYPVVGISWIQANAFCDWRTKLWKDYTSETGELNGENFRLPFESEWEYAARGGLELAPYPWGGPYVRNSKGCLLANFKPGRGNYSEDGGTYTVKVGSYHANDYGLYDMAGNVSEWTSTAFHEGAYSYDHDMNPDIRYDAKQEDNSTRKRKVIRGGSWKDIAYYIQTGTRHWEYQDTSKSYIGFRCVITQLGRSK